MKERKFNATVLYKTDETNETFQRSEEREEIINLSA